MKKLLVMICSAVAFLLNACSTDVDLYADYKQIPIIYGLLEPNADTNFIKITRAFYVQGDAHQAATNPDSSNYPGKLDVRLVEYLNGDSLREIILDTITIHNKQAGQFYHPHQKLYYTTEPLGMNGKSRTYSYRLKVALPERMLVSNTVLVGNRNFGVQSMAVNFSREYFGTRRPFLFRPALNATYYEVSMSFTFKEQRTPDGDSVPRTLSWHVGSLTEEYLSTHMTDGYYSFIYRPETFYEQLIDFIGGDTAVEGLRRFIGDYPIEVSITACGDELWQYQNNNDPLSGFHPGDNAFSLIDGGYGVFSSRMTAKQRVRMGGETVPELVAKTKWGFKFIGGRDNQD